MKFNRWFKLDATGEGGDPGGAAAVSDAAAGGAAADNTAPVVPAAGDAGTPDDGKTSALAQGAEGAKPVPPTFPEKFQVKKEDGSIDVEASSLKLAEAYGHLEKRVGTGELAPKTAEEYQITVPDSLKDVWNPKEDPLLKGFLEKAHAAGYNQKQIDLAMSSYMAMAPELVNAGKILDAESCTAELRTEWKSDEQYKAGLSQAYKAAVGYFGKDAESMIAEYGNDPRFIRGMAKLGSEMSEDKPLNFDSGKGDGQGVEALMASPAYTDPKHPDHKRVSQQIKTHFDRLSAAQEKAGGGAVM